MLFNYTPEEQFELYKANSDNVKFIKNISEDVFLAIVHSKRLDILFEHFPNKMLLLEKLNSSDRMKMCAIGEDPNVLKYIKDPTPEMIILSISKDGDNIQYIENQTDELKLIASKTSIKYIQCPSEDIIRIAFKHHKNALIWVENSPLDLQYQYILGYEQDISRLKTYDPLLPNFAKSIMNKKYNPDYFYVYAKYGREYNIIFKEMTGMPITILLLIQPDTEIRGNFSDYDITFKY